MPDPDSTTLIARAIADPGKILPRVEGESVARWGARAVEAVLQAHGHLSEYRFIGSLGFGGKFWRNNGRWYVTAYREDLTPERQAVIDATNAALTALKQGE